MREAIAAEEQKRMVSPTNCSGFISLLSQLLDTAGPSIKNGAHFTRYGFQLHTSNLDNSLRRCPLQWLQAVRVS